MRGDTEKGDEEERDERDEKEKKERRQQEERERERKTPKRDRTVDARAKTGSAGDQRDQQISEYVYRNRVEKQHWLGLWNIRFKKVSHYVSTILQSTKLLRSSR